MRRRLGNGCQANRLQVDPFDMQIPPALTEVWSSSKLPATSASVFDRRAGHAGPITHLTDNPSNRLSDAHHPF